MASKKKNFDDEVIELPELAGLEDLEFGDLGADLFSKENLKFIAEVAAGGSLAVLVSNLVDSQLKKVNVLGPYLGYISPAVPFAIALAAMKYVVPNPRWRDVGVGMIAASAGMGILQILKNYGILKSLGLEGVGFEHPQLGDVYVPPEPILSGVQALPAPVQKPAVPAVHDDEPLTVDEEAAMLSGGYDDAVIEDTAYLV